MKCPGCLQITTVYSHAQTMTLCDYYGEGAERERVTKILSGCERASWWIISPGLVMNVFVAI